MNYEFDEFIEELKASFGEEPIIEPNAELPLRYFFEKCRIEITRTAIACTITKSNTGETLRFNCDDSECANKAKKFIGI